MDYLLSNKIIRRLKHDLFHIILTSILIPSFYYYEVFVVLPHIFEARGVWYYLNLIISIFITFNVSGNMVYGMLTDTSIRGKLMLIENWNTSHWRFCNICETSTPPRSWHCQVCDVCILKRDHHCNFFACCIGYFNHRYFFMFVIYIFVSMTYCLILNSFFIADFVKWNNGMAILLFMFPLAAIAWDTSSESLYAFLTVINFVLVIFTGFLIYYHGRNVVRGLTTHEGKHGKDKVYDMGWKKNLLDVFGRRWYLVWVSPTINSSPLMDGVNWIDTVKTE